MQMMPQTTAPASSTPFGQPRLEQLLALSRPEHTARGMFILSALNTVQRLNGEEARDRCQRISGEKRVVDFFSYPVASLLRTLYTAAEELGPRLGGTDYALRRLGERAVTDFFETVAGKTVLMLAGNDARRFVMNMPTAYRMAASYGERRIEWTGTHSALLHQQEDYLPVAYHEGVLSMSLERIGARNPQVEGEQVGPLDARYLLRWG